MRNVREDLHESVKVSTMCCRQCAANNALQTVRCRQCAATHPLLEEDDLLLGQGVRLGNHRDKVDLGVESPHELDVDGLETEQVGQPFARLRLCVMTTDRLE